MQSRGLIKLTLSNVVFMYWAGCLTPVEHSWHLNRSIISLVVMLLLFYIPSVKLGLGIVAY